MIAAEKALAHVCLIAEAWNPADSRYRGIVGGGKEA
jgi:hypothetical protein